MVVDFAERATQRRPETAPRPRDASELERDLLASLLFDGSQYPDVADLAPEVLGDPAIRAAYEVLRRAEGKVTPATLRVGLERSEPGRWALTALGGEEGLHRLWLEGKAAGKAVALLPPIREAAVERAVERAFAEAPRERFADAGEWAAVLSNRVAAAGGLLAPAFDTQGLARGAEQALRAYEWSQDNPGKLRGIRTGMPGVDQALGGLQPGQLVLCGGHSNEGKSQMMAFWAWNAVTRLHDLSGEYPAGAYFALEMSEEEMSARWIALRARIDLRAGYALDEVRARVRQAAQDVARLADRLIVIEAKVASSTDQIVRTLRRLKAERGIGFAVIDYAQLVSPSGRFDSRYEGLGELARRLKLVAQELGIAIVLGVQLTRAAIDRPAGRPTAADIADSHDLFRHADAVFYVWTPYKYVVGEWQKPLLGKALVLNAKARGGGLAEAEVFEFMPQFTTFAPVRPEIAAEVRRVLDEVAKGQRASQNKRKEAA